jgi:hypothetical protein
MGFVVGVGERLNELLVVERFDDEVVGAVFESGHRQFDVGVGGEQHHGGLRPQALDLAQPIEAFVAVVDAAVEVHVEQHHVGLVLSESRGETGGGGNADNLVEGLLHHHLHRGEDIAVVVDDE